MMLFLVYKKNSIITFAKIYNVLYSYLKGTDLNVLHEKAHKFMLYNKKFILKNLMLFKDFFEDKYYL